MNNQQAFNIMVTHLREQQVAAIDPDTNYCVYRGPNGTKCAVGALIPDSLYSPDMEKKDARDLMDTHGHILEPVLKDVSLDLLLEVQAIHDVRIKRNDNWFIIEKKFEDIATKFGLTMPIPTNS